MFFYLLKSIPIVTYEIYLFTKVNADFYFVFGLYSSSFSLAYGSCFAISLSLVLAPLCCFHLLIQFTLQVILAFLTWAFPLHCDGPNVDAVRFLFC